MLTSAPVVRRIAAMRDFPSCFGENGVQVADSSSVAKNTQNLVSCVYQTQFSGQPCLITVTWSKNLMGQGFSIGIDNAASQCLCKVDIKPWLFSKRKGSKSLETDKGKFDIYWDFSAAKFGSGPEPLEGFYLAVVFELEMVLLLGDLNKEAHKKSHASLPPFGAVFVAKKEHVFGKKVYCTSARLQDNGLVHDIAIECEAVGLKDPLLEIRIDKKRVMQIKHLAWKFRGNQTIVVDGVPVEVFWDVHNWLFGAPTGNAVFMFQSSLSDEKLVPRSCTQMFRDKQSQGLGFSLILHAWKNE